MNSKISSQLSDKWLKAAVIGGLWASIEIVVGSFLHNLRIPFAGTILATQGVLILIAFSQIWKESGVLIRAGIITALMKSISPSSVILGPMIGILMEAALLEIILTLFKRGFFGAIIAAAAALSTTLLHKLFSILLLYGWNIVTIYKNIYGYFQKMIQFQILSPFEFVMLILIFYLLFGAIAGVLGVYIGRKASTLSYSNPSLSINNISSGEIFPLASSQNFSLKLLYLNFLAIPLGLILISKDALHFGLPFLLLFSLLSYFQYKTIFRRLQKPIFWGQLLLIILLAGFFFNTSSGFLPHFDLIGLFYGLEMSLRAVFVVLIFTNISIELRNPRIKQFLYAHHLGSLHASLTLAFSALPSIIKTLPPVKKFFKSPLETFSLLIAVNVDLYNSYKKQAGQ